MATKVWYEANKVKMRAYRKKWYNANKAKQIALVINRRRGLAQWITELKEKLVCDCGEDHVATLDFHHEDPKKKSVSVTDAVFRYCWSKERILAEIAKCKIKCSNCHRKHHWGEK